MKLKTNANEDIFNLVVNIKKNLPTLVASVRPFTGVGTKMPAQFADFHTSIVTQGALEGFLMCVTISYVSRKFATCYECHYAIFFLTFVWFNS